MIWNPSDAVESFSVQMFIEYNAKTWDEVENLVLEGWVTDYPESVRVRIFDAR